jgi:hypothetical protein
MRLRTAVELLKATKDIESQLEKVTIACTFAHGSGSLCFVSFKHVLDASHETTAFLFGMYIPSR